jgi:hypothetical protein
MVLDRSQDLLCGKPAGECGPRLGKAGMERPEKAKRWK